MFGRIVSFLVSGQTSTQFFEFLLKHLHREMGGGEIRLAM